MNMIKGSYCILRGGGWVNSEYFCTVSYRYYYYPNHRYRGTGFRIAIGGDLK